MVAPLSLLLAGSHCSWNHPVMQNTLDINCRMQLPSSISLHPSLTSLQPKAALSLSRSFLRQQVLTVKKADKTMIAGLSKAVTLYLAHFSLTAILLSLFAFLAPTLLLHDRVALLTVTPSVSLTQPGSSQDVDGPSIFLGLLGMVLRPYLTSMD